MSDAKDIPVLTDLIESGPEVTLFDLGLDDDPAIGAGVPARSGDTAIDLDKVEPVTFAAATPPAIEITPAKISTTGQAFSDIDPVLEQALRRILDKHMELAWQEIRLTIQQHLKRP